MLVDRAPSPASETQRQERSIYVADALAALPRDYREVLRMRSIEGLGFPEVAERMC